MSTVGQGSEKKDYQRFELQGKGKLIITKKLQGQIDYLHDKIGSFEWIGILLYTKEEGSIADPSSVVIKAHKMFAMDIGTSAHTTAKLDAEAVLDIYDRVPDIMELKQGLIHTHHNMDTFFSGEDWSELNDNTPNHNYYLSLIVNFKGVYQAKIALMADLSTAFNYVDCDDSPIHSKSEKKVLMTFSMDIIKEGEEVDEDFKKRYLELKEARDKPTVYVHSLYNTGGGHGYPAKKLDQGEVDQKEKTFRREDKHYTRNQNNSLTYNQARDIGLAWLNEGKKLVMDKESTYQFQTITEGLVALEHHFKSKFSSEEFKSFTYLMQCTLVDLSADYQPSVTAKRLSILFREYQIGTSGAILPNILGQLAEYHPTFISKERKNEKLKHKLTELEKSWNVGIPTSKQWEEMDEKNEKDYTYDEDLAQWRLM